MRAHTHTHSCRHVHTHARARTPTCTHKEKYVILISFPRQQWFRERASVLRYTYIACLVILYSHFKFTTRSICFIFSYLVSSNREAPHYSVFPSILHDKNKWLWTALHSVCVLQVQVEKSFPYLREAGVQHCVGPRYLQADGGLPGRVPQIRKGYHIQFLWHILECRRRIQRELTAWATIHLLEWV
jgi:hypothetical protein